MSPQHVQLKLTSLSVNKTYKTKNGKHFLTLFSILQLIANPFETWELEIYGLLTEFPALEGIRIQLHVLDSFLFNLLQRFFHF